MLAKLADSEITGMRVNQYLMVGQNPKFQAKEAKLWLWRLKKHKD